MTITIKADKQRCCFPWDITYDDFYIHRGWCGCGCNMYKVFIHESDGTCVVYGIINHDRSMWE